MLLVNRIFTFKWIFHFQWKNKTKHGNPLMQPGGGLPANQQGAECVKGAPMLQECLNCLHLFYKIEHLPANHDCEGHPHNTATKMAIFGSTEYTQINGHSQWNKACKNWKLIFLVKVSTLCLNKLNLHYWQTSHDLKGLSQTLFCVIGALAREGA